MLDYLVVGLGLSGLSICNHLENRGRSFVVFENDSQSSSKIAGGIYNPVILKRFTLAWEADKQINYAMPFYKNLEIKLNKTILNPFSIYRKFYSAEEQNNWFEAADNFRLSPFLNTRLVKNVNPFIPGGFSFGKVEQTGALNTASLILTYKDRLKDLDKLKLGKFEHEKLQIKNGYLVYEDIKAKQVIFCEGYGLQENPYFNYLPMRGNKGGYLIIRSSQLQLKNAVKSSVFILPLGNDLYKVGATYNHQDKSQEPTKDARNKLQEQLHKLITCEYEIIDQVAGIRPATSDRRPLAGRHPVYENLYLCNGFGSRGVLIAPLLSEKLLNFIEDDIPLSPEVDIQRFTKKYFNA